MARTILMKLGQNAELINFGRKMQKWCPEIALYLENRKCYRKSYLIFGIYRPYPFPTVSSDFCLLAVFFRHENSQFWCFFEWFSGIFLDKFWPNSLGSDRKWAQSRHKKDCRSKFRASLKIFRLKVGKNCPKSTKINPISPGLYVSPGAYGPLQKILGKCLQGLGHGGVSEGSKVWPRDVAISPKCYRIFDTRLRQNRHKILQDHGNANIFSGNMHN